MEIEEFKKLPEATGKKLQKYDWDSIPNGIYSVQDIVDKVGCNSTRALGWLKKNAKETRFDGKRYWFLVER